MLEGAAKDEDHLSFIAERIDATQAEVKVIRDKSAVLDKSISSLIARIGSRPRETLDEIKKELQRLEKVHASTPQSNADERKFMMEMDKLRQKKKQVTEQQAAQLEIDAFKVQRTELQQQLREKLKILDELYSGSRKLKAASKSGAKTADIIEESINIPEDKMAHVIGRGGSSLRQFENDHGVHIDTERQGSCLRITGTAEAVENARSAIASKASICTEEFAVSQDKIACLALDAAEMVQELQRQYDVRIDVSRAKKVCKVVGILENITAAKAAILGVPSATIVIPIEPAFLPFILGKSGATIRQIGEDNHVSIDITREANILEVLGLRENVTRAANTIRDLIDANKEMEDTLSMDRRVLMGCILGAGGLKIRVLQKDLHVFLHTDKSTAEGEGAAPPAAPAATLSKVTVLRIRGTQAHVSHAKIELQKLIHDYDSNTEVFPVPEDCLSSIVGKQGASIKKMREEYPDVQVDIDGSFVRLHSECDASRSAVRQLISQIVDANFSSSVSFELDTLIVLKGAKGAELRVMLVEKLGLNMDIQSEEGLVRLRGKRASVEEGTRALEAFQEENVCAVLSCTEDDCNAFTQGGTENVLKKSVEEKFSVDIYVSRKDSMIRIRGGRAAIAAAKAFVEGALRGDSNHNSLVISANPLLFSSLIGKGGANMKKWETEFPGVRIDLLKDRGLIRVLGPEEQGKAVQKMLLDHMEGIKVMSKLDLESVVEAAAAAAASTSASPRSSPKTVDSVIALATSLFQVQIEKVEDSKNIFNLKGAFSAVEEAKQYIVELVGGQAARTISVSSSHMAALKATAACLKPKDALFKNVQDEFGVTIALDEKATQVVVSGPTDSAFEAKIRVVSLLEAMFPCEFASIVMSHSCLKQLGSQRVLAEINLGAHIYADRPSSCVRIYGGAIEVNNTARCFRQKMMDWFKKRAEFPYEDHMLSALLGKGGANIAALQEKMAVSLDINRQTRMIEIHASTKDILLTARQYMEEYLVKLRGEFWETTIDGKNLGALLGKKGASIAKLREETGAKIDVNVNTNVVRVSGSAEAVDLAKEKILGFAEAASNQTTQSVTIPHGSFSSLLGPRGATAQEIQESSGAKLDLDRSNGIATVRGSPEACAKALELVNQVLLESDFDAAVKVTTPAPSSARVEETVEVEPVLVERHPTFALPQQQQRLLQQPLSKSSLRRRRRKEQSGKEDDEDEDDNEEAKEGNSKTKSVPTPSLAPAPEPSVLESSRAPVVKAKTLEPPAIVKTTLPIPPVVEVVEARAPVAPAAGKEAYFKSKSGFAVRM